LYPIFEENDDYIEIPWQGLEDALQSSYRNELPNCGALTNHVKSMSAYKVDLRIFKSL